jgi:hypothetical protein
MMGARLRFIYLIMLAALGTIACDSDGAVNCAPSNALAVALRPVDASSLAPLASVATGMAGFGEYADTLERGPSIHAGADSLAGGFRTGTYSVHVEAPGYAAFDTSGVVVALTVGDCPELSTQRFTARLTLLP